jgi:hypothetical protein
MTPIHILILGLHISDDCRADICNDKAILGKSTFFLQYGARILCTYGTVRAFSGLELDSSDIKYKDAPCVKPSRHEGT